MTRRVFLTSCLLLFSLNVLSCSPGNSATVQTQGPVSSALPDPGVPKVEQPLNIAVTKRNLCETYSKEQVESLGERIRDVGIDDNPVAGLSCNWRLEHAGLFSVGLPPEGHGARGLSDTYQLHNSGFYSAFAPIVIMGYPAIISDRDDHSCSLIIGVRDDQAFNVSVFPSTENPNRSNACPIAQKLGEFLISHVKQTQ